jgi:hypothetical protein
MTTDVDPCAGVLSFTPRVSPLEASTVQLAGVSSGSHSVYHRIFLSLMGG